MKKQPKEQKVTANRAKSNQVKALLEEFPSLNIKDDLEIKESNAHCYVLCALRSSHNAMTGATTWTKQIFTKTEECWNALTDADKSPQKMAAAQRMVILHNPTIEVEETSTSRNSSEPVELTNEQKEDVKELHEAGTALKGIAKELGLRQKDVQPYIETLV